MNYANGRYTSHRDPVRIISRKQFDSVLLDKAASAGAEIVTGDAVVSIESMSLTTSSGKGFSCSNIVGADGCNSLVRKFISGRRRKRTCMGLEYFIPLTDLNEKPEDIQIHFGYIPYGYIWIFPGSEKVNIGAGALGSPSSSSDITRALNGFLEARGIFFDKYQLLGAPVPYLSLDRYLGKANIYLAGETAEPY